MADDTQTTTQQPLPGTTGTTASAAPAGPDVAALTRDRDTAIKAAEKTAKELEAFKKKVESPDYIREVLGTALGLDKKADPVKEMEALKAAVSEAGNQAQAWRGKARSMALKQAAADALDAAKVDPKYRAKALVLLASNGLDALDMDEDALAVRDAAALSKLVDSVKADVPVFFTAVEQPATKTQPTQSGPPFRSSAIPVPGQNGAPPALDVGSSNFMDLLGIGPSPVPMSVIRNLKPSN